MSLSDHNALIKTGTVLFTAMIFIAVLSITARADFSENKWRFYKKITFGREEMGYWLVIVDDEIYDTAQTNLNDLRVITRDGKEIPYRTVIIRKKPRKVSHHAKMFNLSYQPESQTIFMLDMGEEQLFHNRLRIHTSSKNFRRRVELTGSKDQESWYLLREKGYIFDFSEDYHAAHTEVKYPETNYRYLKVTIWDEGEKPLSITGASISRYIVEKADEVELTPALLFQQENKARRATELLFDFGVKGKPCHRSLLEFEDVDYHRQVEIAGSNDREQWRTLATQHIYHIETERYRGKDTEIEFRESQYRYLRISVLNYDDVPLKFIGASFWGIPRKVVFRREPDTPYRLYYGNAKASLPHYDLARIIPHVNLAGSPVAILGSQIHNSAFEPRRKPWTEENAWVLWVALVILVGSLGAIILKSIRQISKAEPGD